MPTTAIDNQGGGGSAANVATSRVLDADWSKFATGPYEKLPTDREAVMDGYLMQRYDPTVGAVLNCIKRLICGNLGTYQHEDDGIAEFINGAVNDIRGGLRRTVASLLSCLWSGFAVAEIVWATDATWRIEAVELLHPLTMWDRYDGKPGIEYDRKAGRVSQIKQMRQQEPNEQIITYPVEQVVYWPFWQELREEVYGKRLTDRARRNWFMRSNIETYWGLFLKRFAHPTPIFRIPKGFQIGDDGNQITNSEYYSKFIQSLAPGNGIAMEVSAEDTFSFDLLESKVGSDRAYETACQYHNKEIFKALLMSPMLLEEPQHGSRAQSGTAMDMFILLVEAIRSELAEVKVQQIAAPMVKYNYGPNVPVGEWVYPELEANDLEMLSRTLESLQRSGAVSLSESDERSVREHFKETGLVALDEIPEGERAEAQEAVKAAPAGFGL
jgi:hypothetical protein